MLASSRPHTADTEGQAFHQGVWGQPRSSAPAHSDAVVWDKTAILAPTPASATERRLKFRSLPQAVGAARLALRQWESHFEPDLFYDLSLCVSELVTNAVVQRRAPGASDEIELVVRRGSALVRAEVKEHSADAIVAPSPVTPPGQTRPSWGMFIVDRVASRWGVDRGEGTTVWCEIDTLSGEAGRGADYRRAAAVS